jgi:hypothetical protein
MLIKMKYSFQYILLIVFCGILFSCKKDNYDEPSSTLSGRLVYQGEPINLQRNEVPFQLYQYGFGLVGPIGSSFAQDGSFSALLFNGEYKLIVPNNQGPFTWKKTAGGEPDSITINLKGSQTLDLEVTPYYMIRNPQFSKNGNTITGTFKLDKIITDANAKDIENVAIYINKTLFVSPNSNENLKNSSIAGSAITDPGNITISVEVPSITPAQNYVFARIGVKIVGVEDRIFSPVTQIQL